MNYLKKIKDTTWEDVFDTWQALEGQVPSWQQHARNIGWPDWHTWRRYMISLFGGIEMLDWAVYQIEDAGTRIPNFLVGPFYTWQKHFDEYFVHTFADLVRTVPEWVQQEAPVEEYIPAFQAPTEFIGLQFDGSDDILLVEGHHRATAVAAAEMHGARIDIAVAPTIALARYHGDPSEMLERVRSTSSRNPNM